ncbi:unnamed protein product [Sphagnum balticum]
MNGATTTPMLGSTLAYMNTTLPTQCLQAYVQSQSNYTFGGVFNPPWAPTLMWSNCNATTTKVLCQFDSPFANYQTSRNQYLNTSVAGYAARLASTSATSAYQCRLLCIRRITCIGIVRTAGCQLPPTGVGDAGEWHDADVAETGLGPQITLNDVSDSCAYLCMDTVSVAHITSDNRRTIVLWMYAAGAATHWRQSYVIVQIAHIHSTAPARGRRGARARKRAVAAHRTKRTTSPHRRRMAASSVVTVRRLSNISFNRATRPVVRAWVGQGPGALHKDLTQPNLIGHPVANVTANAYNSSSACTNLNAGAYVANVYDENNVINNIFGYVLSVAPNVPVLLGGWQTSTGNSSAPSAVWKNGAVTIPISGISPYMNTTLPTQCLQAYAQSQSNYTYGFWSLDYPTLLWSDCNAITTQVLCQFGRLTIRQLPDIVQSVFEHVRVRIREPAGYHISNNGVSMPPALHPSHRLHRQTMLVNVFVVIIIFYVGDITGAPVERSNVPSSSDLETQDNVALRRAACKANEAMALENCFQAINVKAENLVPCSMYVRNCQEYYYDDQPMKQAASLFNSRVGVTTGFGMAGIPYYPFNQEVEVPINEHDLGKPIVVNNGLGVGNFYAQNQGVGVDYVKGNVAVNQGGLDK